MENQGWDQDRDRREGLNVARGVVLGVCYGVILWGIVGLVIVAVWRWTR